MKYLNKLFVFAIVLTLTLSLFSGVGLTAGPKEITIRSLESLVMPEYDNLHLLEVNTVTMYNNSDKEFKGELVWQLPKGAINVVVVKSQNVNTPSAQSLGKVRSQENYDELYWTPNESIPAKGQVSWHIEYYNPNAIQGTNDKTFEYIFQQPYNVNLGSISILQPLKASNFKTDPSPQNQQSTNQGVVYSFQVKENKVSVPIPIKVSYLKTDPNPSFNNNQAQGGQDQGNQTTPQGANNQKNNTTLYVLIALIIIIAAAAIVIIMKSEVNNEIIKTKKRESRKAYQDFYDIEEFDEDAEIDDFIEDELEDEFADEAPEEDEENLDVDQGKVNLIKAKKELRAKFEKGLITEIDYNEQLAELEG